MHPETLTDLLEHERAAQSELHAMAAAFEAQFAAQAPPEHVHGPECDHFHADAHIDHPHDHELENNRDIHEAAHGLSESHVHGPGCGHVEHEHAGAFVERPHLHDENCGHLHHGDATAYVDHHHGTEHAARSNGEEHIHHPGCGHVGHDAANKFVSQPENRQRDEAEAFARAHELQQQTSVSAVKEKDIKTEKQVDKPKRDAKTKQAARSTAKKSGTANGDHDPAVKQPKKYAATKKPARQHVEPPVRVAKKAAQNNVAPLAEAALLISGAPDALRLLHAAYTGTPENRYAVIVDDDAETESSIADTDYVVEDTQLFQTGSNTTARAEMILDKAVMQDVQDVSETGAATHSEAELPAASAIEFGIEAPTLEATVDTADETATIENTAQISAEILDEIPAPGLELSIHGTPLAEAPLAAIENEAAIETTVPEPWEVSIVESPQHAAANVLPETIATRFDSLRASQSAGKPETFKEAEKIVTNLHEVIRKRGVEFVPDAVRSEFVRLLQLLGFKNPERVLHDYIEQFGIDSLHDLLMHLFELLHQARTVEAASAHMQIILPASKQTAASKGLGKLVLTLLTQARQTLSLLPA